MSELSRIQPAPTAATADAVIREKGTEAERLPRPDKAQASRG
jgi:hypothetical protein